MSQSRHWCLTINNPVVDDVPDDKSQFEYIIVGNEVGTEGTNHLQMYICFNSRVRLTQVKKLFPRAHIERMRGSPTQAAAYCKKDGDFEDWG